MKPQNTSADYTFDEAAADRAVDFIEKFCTHVKGELGRETVSVGGLAKGRHHSTTIWMEE